jgi:hypothetical protein
MVGGRCVGVAWGGVGKHATIRFRVQKRCVLISGLAVTFASPISSRFPVSWFHRKIVLVIEAVSINHANANKDKERKEKKRKENSAFQLVTQKGFHFAVELQRLCLRTQKKSTNYHRQMFSRHKKTIVQAYAAYY